MHIHSLFMRVRATPRHVFCTCGCTLLVAINIEHQCKNDDQGNHDLTLKKTKPTQAIPSSPLFLWTELSSIFSQLCQEGILRGRMILGKWGRGVEGVRALVEGGIGGGVGGGGGGGGGRRVQQVADETRAAQPVDLENYDGGRLKKLITDLCQSSPLMFCNKIL